MFWIRCEWRHNHECRKLFTPDFHIFVNLIKYKPFTQIYGCFGYLLWTYKVVKFWLVKLWLSVSDVIHANEHTECDNCGLESFGWCHFVLWWEKIILSKTYYFSLRSPLSYYAYILEFFTAIIISEVFYQFQLLFDLNSSD